MNSGRKPLYTDRILVYGPSSMAVFKHKENRKFGWRTRQFTTWFTVRPPVYGPYTGSYLTISTLNRTWDFWKAGGQSHYMVRKSLYEPCSAIYDHWAEIFHNFIIFQKFIISHSRLSKTSYIKLFIVLLITQVRKNFRSVTIMPKDSCLRKKGLDLHTFVS